MFCNIFLKIHSSRATNVLFKGREHMLECISDWRTLMTTKLLYLIFGFDLASLEMR